MVEDQPGVAVSLLGGVAIRRGTVPEQLTSTRSVALLAYLASRAPVPQPRTHLAALFWPDTPEAQARTNLRRELHQLRQLVPESSLHVTASVIGWVDGNSCSVDVRSFLSLQEQTQRALRSSDLDQAARAGLAAIETYAGPFLPGLYDDWVTEERDRLHRVCVALCDDLALRLAQPDLRSALFVARRRVQLEPLEEVGYRELMRLQVADHDRSGALTTYHACAVVLNEQLGVAPTSETSSVLTTIIELPDGPTPESLEIGRWEPADRSPDEDLVGRTEEFGVVLRRWQEASSGRPGMLLLTGDPGVGKSRLLDELVRAVVRARGAVARSRCFSTSGVALAPVADWLRSPDVSATRTSLDPVWQLEVDRLVPSSATSVRDADDLALTSSRALVDSWQQHRFYEGLSHAMLSVERPLLLVLDDLQWCDEETLAWIAFLLRLAKDRPLLVLAAARSDELEQKQGLRDMIAELASARLLTAHHVDPLASPATAELATRMFGRSVDDAEAELLHAASGGYPLYVVEAARGATNTSRSEITAQGLSAILRRRLSELSPEARRCVALAAAIGRDFRLELLVEASDQDDVTVVRAVDELWRRHVLRQVGRGYDFSHDLLRDEAYASTAPAQRWLEHRRLARALEVLNADDLDQVAVSLAEQHERGGRPEQAVPFYFRAAVGAARLFANNEALRLFRRCLDIVLELPPSQERDRRELEVRAAMSAPMNAIRGYADRELHSTFERCVQLSQTLERRDLELASLVGLWASTFVQGDTHDAHRIATNAIALADDVPTLANQAHFTFGGSALSLGKPDVGVRELDLACDLSMGDMSLIVGSRPEVHARAWSAHGWWLLGDDDRAGAACRDAIAQARELNHPYSLVVALAYASVTAQLREDVVLLDTCLAELTELCERYAYAYYREWALILAGWRLGGERGAAKVKLGIAHLSQSGSLARMPYWLSLLAETQRSVERHDSAESALASAYSAGVERGDHWWLPEVLRLQATASRTGDAVTLLERAETLAWRQQSPALAARCRTDLERLGARSSASASSAAAPRR